MRDYNNDNWFCPIFRFEAGRPLAPVSQDASLEKVSDEKLLELIKDGTRSQRQDAFSEVYRRYYEDVWRFTMSKGLSEAEAKDIFSEVWIVALEKLCQFEWQGKPFKGL